MHEALPVAVIGAGPVGMAAAVRLIHEGHEPVVFEAGQAVGASILNWGHVTLFSPWQYNVDDVARAMLEARSWTMPDGESYHTGRELVDLYLQPLAGLPEIAPAIRLNTTVTAITRVDHDKMKDGKRDDAPFVVRYQTADGEEGELLAKSVIDASGTYRMPNPLGAGGVPALGERAATGQIYYGIPDVLGRDRERYANRRVLVIGSGHSAFNALLDLIRLRESAPETAITWAVRRPAETVNFGGGESDQLPARGELGLRLKEQVGAGGVELVSGFQTRRITRTEDGLLVAGDDAVIGPVDEIVATTGFRPDLSILGELRLDLDAAVESPSALAPLIDPNVHSCGTVRPHGAEELKHLDLGFYIAGMKSYGRAPTFLLVTGYEQVRSIVAAISGDWERARRVELVLPETGVCTLGSQPSNGAACCTAETEAVPLAIASAVSCCGSPQPALVNGTGGSGCCS